MFRANFRCCSPTPKFHADNPEFQRDMLATVRASVGNHAPLTRLQADRQEREPSSSTRSSRCSACGVWRPGWLTGTVVELCDDGGSAGVAIDPESFDAVIQHLLNNAIEASGQAARSASCCAMRR